MSAGLHRRAAPLVAVGAAPGRRRRLDAAVVVVPGLVATALALVGLTARSLGFDEGATVSIVSQHGSALWHAIAHDGGNMAGYYLLLHVLVGAFGDGPWVLRLPSVVFAGLTPMFVSALGLALWGGPAGGHPGGPPERATGGAGDTRRRVQAGLGGLLCAVSLPLVYWGQTARGYAAMLCFACAAMLCFVRLVDAACGRERWGGWAVGYVVAMGLAVYSGFIVLLVVLVQVVALLGRRRALGRFVVGGLVPLGIVCIPIAVLALRRGSGQLFWVPPPSGQVDTQVLQSLTASGLQSTFHPVFSTTPGWVLTGLVVLALLALAVRAGRRLEWGTGLVLVWALLPAVVTFVASLVVQPTFLPRNLLISVPAVALAVALFLCDRRLPRWAAAGGVLIALLIRVVPTVAAVGVSSEPWDVATARVLAAARPGDCIAFYPEDARNPFRWYAARSDALDRAPRSVLPDVPWSSNGSYVERYRTLSARQVAGLGRGCRRVWLVWSHEGQPNGPAASRRHLATVDALRAHLEHAFGSAGAREVNLGWASTIHLELIGGRRRGG